MRRVLGTYGSSYNVGRQEWDSRRKLPDRRINGNWSDISVVHRRMDVRVVNKDSNGFRYRGGEGNRRNSKEFKLLSGRYDGDNQSQYEENSRIRNGALGSSPVDQPSTVRAHTVF
ncbi:hypothetical protein TNIN_94351 [Trichonephila inaurata madagascariensis]|uniref:Uncharacterized protein n=1 Tax=Trichonephila inaurata madagascariensis TaxID=2747483 RepID=A0A8X6XQ92_9ARAC|nr:hypothetical protein TNIN_94351 [Trichonephila inaurata madagascariensis]